MLPASEGIGSIGSCEAGASCFAKGRCGLPIDGTRSHWAGLRPRETPKFASRVVFGELLCEPEPRCSSSSKSLSSVGSASHGDLRLISFRIRLRASIAPSLVSISHRVFSVQRCRSARFGAKGPDWSNRPDSSVGSRSWPSRMEPKDPSSTNRSILPLRLWPTLPGVERFSRVGEWPTDEKTALDSTVAPPLLCLHELRPERFPTGREASAGDMSGRPDRAQ
mmetsp:Transcript_21108/g.50916  ORF Transcript_21108/g.50916 Transcript_21108/m.50916 type:complete len:222 (-) Transcript_21108:3798-4463(-)